MRNATLLSTVAALGLLVSCRPELTRSSETVSFTSEGRVLQGLLWKPAGAGPFPTVLYNHGSAPGMLNNETFESLGPMFAARGWVFFAPYRRGQGLSSGAGPYIRDEISAAYARGGEQLAAETMVRLHATDHLQDQMAALAWIKAQEFVEPGQIAAMGNSFGGIQTVLGTARGGYCAGVDASGGAQSWDRAPNLQQLMSRAAAESTAPILFFQAENDYTLAPSQTLHAAMKAAGKPTELRIYAPFGQSQEDGHSFAYRGAHIFFDDVMRFLDAHCRR